MDTMFLHPTATTSTNDGIPYHHDLHLQQQQQPSDSSSLSEKLLSNDYHDSTTTNPYVMNQQQQQYGESLFLPINDTNNTNTHHFGVPPNHINNGTRTTTSSTTTTTNGEKQENLYRDIWATILFSICQCIVLYLAFIRGTTILQLFHRTNDTNDSDTDDTVILSLFGLIYMVLLSTIVALLVSVSMIALLMKFVNSFIQLTLGIVIVGNIMVLLFCIQNSLWYGCVGALCFLLFSIFRGQSFQKRIPFAAANIRVACTAISINYGLLLIAVGVSIVVNFIYSTICIFALMGSLSKDSVEHPHGDENNVSSVVVIFLLIMYYWTSEIGKNIIHVTTAGVMGTFWFVPHDASTFWSPAIYDSFYRSITYSFGSICFGSLVTTILYFIHYWVREIRNVQRRTTWGPSIVLCALECISGFLERIITYFNKWAYVYIGLYGYDYLTAGSKVITLFSERGWTAIINDQLVGSVLTLVSIIIGIGAGCFGILLSFLHQSWVQGFGDGALVIAFFIPGLIGIAMSIILTSVIRAAVDTVVVAFAEAPMELEQNHPGLSAQLNTAWRHVYPEEYGR